MYEWLDYFRIVLCFSFLVIASFHDFKTREAPNWIWILFAPSGFMLSFLQFLLAKENSFLFIWMSSFLITTGLSLIIFHFGLFGGADAKALICLSLALPAYPSLIDHHLNVYFSLFPLSVFINALLGSSSLVFVIAGYNFFRLIQIKGRLFEGLESELFWKKMIAFITGFKIDIDKLKKSSHYVPIEYFTKGEGGKLIRHLRVSPRFEEEKLSEDLHDFSEEMNGKIWVTFNLPFLLFITVSFVITLLFGDIIGLIIKLIATKVV